MIESVTHLVNNCLKNLNQSELELVQYRMKDFLEQAHFWLERENRKRFLYDLNTFGNWLCDFIADHEKKFWGEEESS